MLLAQPDSRPRFEVASVKPSAADSRIHLQFSQGQAVLTHVRLKDVVLAAYNLPRFLVSGGPGWMDTEHYDIVGKLAPTEGAPPPQAQVLQALQVLLEERFRLKLHWETRRMPLYRLTVAKSGFKLKEGDPLPDNTPGGFLSSEGGRLVRRNVTIADLASSLSLNLGDPVEDATGLEGRYSFVLEWHREINTGANVDEAGIVGALRSRLGLNLERGDGPVKTLVIDSAERPEAN